MGDTTPDQEHDAEHFGHQLAPATAGIHDNDHRPPPSERKWRFLGPARLAGDLAEEPHQSLGRCDVRAVAGGDLEVAPGGMGFEAPGELQEYVVGLLPRAVDVAA